MMLWQKLWRVTPIKFRVFFAPRVYNIKLAVFFIVVKSKIKEFLKISGMKHDIMNREIFSEVQCEI